MKKRAISILLTGTMVLSLCGCGGGKSESKSGGSKGDYEQVTFAYATMNNVPTEEGLSAVEDAVNEVTREKIGVEVTLKPIALADYSQSVSRSLQGGEKIDVFQTIYDFSNCVSTGMGLDISDLIGEYAPETQELIGETWLDACRVDGKLYGVPVYKPVAARGCFLGRKDIIEELKVDLSSVKSTADLTDIFKAVHEKHPEMTVLAPMSQGRLGENAVWSEIDYLSDSDTGAWGVLIGDDMTVQDLYGSDLFAESADLVREWYEAGYVMKDAATTTSSMSELMSSGNYFGFFTINASSEEDLAGQLSGLCANQLEAVALSEPYIYTSSINMVTAMIASNTKVPEAAMKFVNMLYSDADVINAIIFGVEGRDYVLDEEGYAGYPEGQDATTVPYTAQMDNGIMGNAFIMHPVAGTSKESMDYALEQNHTAPVSPAMGFSFDNSSVASQYTAVANVTNQYLPGLLCGSVDPKTEIPKFIKALNDAGYQDIIDAKQKQLDEWAEKNK